MRILAQDSGLYRKVWMDLTDHPEAVRRFGLLERVAPALRAIIFPANSTRAQPGCDSRSQPGSDLLAHLYGLARR